MTRSSSGDTCREAVQLVAADQETDAGLLVGGFVIVNVACPGKYLQGTVYPDGEMMETLAELVDVEFTGHSIAVTCCQLVVIGQMFIDLADVIAGWEGIVDALAQFGIVALVVQHHGISLLSVSSGTTRFLEVGFDRVGTVVVCYQSDVGLVNAHSEGVGSDDDAYPVVLPVALPLVFDGMLQSGVIVGCAEPRFVQVFGNLLGTSATAHIDNGRALCVVKNMYQFMKFVSHMCGQVCQVLALERHAEDAE